MSLESLKPYEGYPAVSEHKLLYFLYCCVRVRRPSVSFLVVDVFYGQKKIPCNTFERFPRPCIFLRKLQSIDDEFQLGGNLFCVYKSNYRPYLTLGGSSIANGCYAKNVRSTELYQVSFGRRGTNEHDSVAGFRLALFATTRRPWRSSFKDNPLIYIYIYCIMKTTN